MFMDDSITRENVVGWMIGDVIYGNECDAVPIKKFLESACNCLIVLPRAGEGLNASTMALSYLLWGLAKMSTVTFLLMSVTLGNAIFGAHVLVTWMQSV